MDDYRTIRAFRPLFDAATAELSPESRAVAWDSCFSVRKKRLKARAVRCYLALAVSVPPFEPTGGRLR